MPTFNEVRIICFELSSKTSFRVANMKMIVFTNNIPHIWKFEAKLIFALNLLRSEFDAEAEYRQRLREQAEERSGDKVSWLPYSTNMIDQLDKYVYPTQQIWLHNFTNMIALLNKYDWPSRQIWLQYSINMIDLLDRYDCKTRQIWLHYCITGQLCLPNSTNMIAVLNKLDCPSKKTWLPIDNHPK